MSKKIVIKCGDRYGRINVVEEINPKSGERRFRCVCVCGRETTPTLSNLRSGKTTSCGRCIRRPLKHGMCQDRFYEIWERMLNRIRNPKDISWPNYGGRGISVSTCWFEFINFKNDMYKSYVEHVAIYGEKNTSIERLDNGKDYFKDNCIWATKHVQSRNKRNNVKFNNEISVDASRRLGGCDLLVSARIRKGWSIEKAFTAPLQK